MSSGNHMVDQGERDMDRRGRCSCGGSLAEIDWCSEQDCECYKSCDRNIPAMPCYMAETKLKCRRCEVIVDSD